MKRRQRRFIYRRRKKKLDIILKVTLILLRMIQVILELSRA